MVQRINRTRSLRKSDRFLSVHSFLVTVFITNCNHFYLAYSQPASASPTFGTTNMMLERDTCISTMVNLETLTMFRFCLFNEYSSSQQFSCAFLHRPAFFLSTCSDNLHASTYWQPAGCMFRMWSPIEVWRLRTALSSNWSLIGCRTSLPALVCIGNLQFCSLVHRA